MFIHVAVHFYCHESVRKVQRRVRHIAGGLMNKFIVVSEVESGNVEMGECRVLHLHLSLHEDGMDPEGRGCLIRAPLPGGIG